MALKCSLCGKKLGFFSAYGDDVLTGDPDKKICETCLQAADVILKKVELKIPLEDADFERFSEEGTAFMKSYIETEDEELLEMAGETADAEEKELMDHEVGDAVIDRTFSVDEDETEVVLKELRGMTNDKIEQYLEGLVSENDTAESFMRGIIGLSDEELQEVLSEQREYYNNAEWAFILYVSEYRDHIAHLKDEKKEKLSSDESILQDDDLNPTEIARMTEVFRDKTAEELKEIADDASYTPEARTAAKNLLNQQ